MTRNTHCPSATAVAAIAALFALTITPISGHAQTYRVIYTFTGHSRPANPIAGVTLDQHGNLFGTTAWGGAFGGGAIYELKPGEDGVYTFNDLHDLGQGLDGSFAWGGVTIGPEGVLYGTTYTGGTSGDGIIFSLRPPARFCASISCPWDESIVYNFTRGSDGGNAQASVVFDASGNMYGTNVNAGAGNSGVIFEMTPSGGAWAYHVLYPFTGGSDGANPDSLLLFDQAGNMYGSALAGGNPGCSGYGCGTIFELSPTQTGWTAQALYAFNDGTDGANPQSGVVMDGAGNIYTATGGSDASTGGTVLELLGGGGSWAFHLIDDLSGQGPGPSDRLLRDSAGNLYGTTWGDGAYGNGNVFRLTPNGSGWTYTSLHDFTGGADGGNAFGGLVMDSHGNIFGTTYLGGLQSCGFCGVVFEISPN